MDKSKETHEMKIIAHISSPFPEKFGIPRQSGMAKARAKIIMEPAYRNPDAFRGLEGFSHLWLIWQFSGAVREIWSPTVRPPRLGGNRRMGVFATRSPFRPNAIGLSSVKIEEIDLHTELGPVITVSGADLLDGTPIYDIKPYLAFTDSHPEAMGGFSDDHLSDHLEVDFPDALKSRISPDLLGDLISILSSDPRPSYQDDPDREYGLRFDAYEVKFKVNDRILSVFQVEKIEKS